MVSKLIKNSISEKLMAWLPVACLLLPYPLALLIPAGLGVEGRFLIELPAFLFLALLSIPYLILRPLVGRDRIGGGRHLQAGFLLIIPLIMLSSAASGRFSFQSALIAIAYFAVPLYFATVSRRRLPRQIVCLLAIFWAVQAIHGLLQLKFGQEVVGTTGNRNWLAALIVALAPWPGLALVRCRQWRFPHQNWLVLSTTAWRRRALHLGLIGLSLAISLLLAIHGQSRAVWLTLTVYLLAFQVWPRLRRRRSRIGFVLGLLLGGALALSLAGAYLHNALNEDIRLPLWQATGRMIMQHPLLGVGPGNFTSSFTAYKTLEQKRRAVSAPVTEHPHNELLRLAAELGLPLALAWCVILIPLLRRPGVRSGFWQAVHFSAFILIGAGMFDKTLVQPPTRALALILLGILWRRRLKVRSPHPPQPTPQRRKIELMLVIGLVTYGLVSTTVALMSTWHLRRGMLAENAGEYAKAYDAYDQAARIAPANPRFHTYAAFIANRKLHDPKRALAHLDKVWQGNRDFGHINAEIGLALAQMQQYQNAIPFFQREADLFPFDHNAQAQLLRTLIRANAAADLHPVLARLAQARHHHLTMVQSPHELAATAELWLEAVRLNHPQAAMRAAHQLSSRLILGISAEPGFQPLAEHAGLPPDFCQPRFGPADFRYWRFILACQQSARRQTHRTDTVPELWRKITAAPDSGDIGARFDLPAIYVLIEQLRQLSCVVARVTHANGQALGVLEVRRNNETWLVTPDGQAEAGTASQLLTDPALAEAFGLLDQSSNALHLIVPVPPPDFCERTQVLGQVLKEFSPAAPAIGIPPALTRQKLQSASIPDDRRGTVHFDPDAFRAWRQLLSPSENSEHSP